LLDGRDHGQRSHGGGRKNSARDGFVGIAALLGADSHAEPMLHDDRGARLPHQSQNLQEHFESSSQLRPLPFCAACIPLLVQTAQNAACNRVHELPERLARWILMCDDRLGAGHAPVTQDMLAMMLGTRRSSISVAAGVLKKAGYIGIQARRVDDSGSRGTGESPRASVTGWSKTSICGWPSLRARSCDVSQGGQRAAGPSLPGQAGFIDVHRISICTHAC